MLEGPSLDSKVDRALQKMVEMIKTIAHQINEHYLDLSKSLKKMEEREVTRVKEAVVKEQ